VGKAGAVFNVEKLNWLNFQYLRKKPATEMLVLLKEELVRAGLGGSRFDDAYLLRVIDTMRERVTFPRDLVEISPYFFQQPGEYDPDVVKKRWTRETPGRLEVLRDEFSKLVDPKREDYEAALRSAAGKLGITQSELIHPLRLAVSGVGAGPGLYDILFILGKDETLQRITAAIGRIK
jgi:glutamyl/glutaminyl-tRNA synthetase